MVVASGIIEVKSVSNVGKIAGEIKRRGMNVDNIAADRILFIMERESVDAVRSAINSLRGIDDVKNVHLTYYSIEDTVEKLHEQ